jgi:uncharacterized membrane protein
MSSIAAGASSNLTRCRCLQQFYIIYIFICGLFEDAVGISDTEALNGGIITE